MKKLIITLAIIFSTVAYIQSQSLKTASLNQDILKTTSYISSSVNLKLNYYIHFSEVRNRVESGFGFLSEYQILTSKKFGWIFTANVLSLRKEGSDGTYYTKFGGLVLTVGPKLYFNNSDFQGYASFGTGARISGEYSAITFTPALGIEYKISKSIKLNLEVKSNLYIDFQYAYYAYSNSLFLNGGIGIKL